MLEIRIVEDAGSFETQRIWEGVVASHDEIGSRFAIEPEVVSRLGESELRVEQKDGSDWIDIGNADHFLPDVCSIDLISENHDDIMFGWRIDGDLSWEDHAPLAAPSQTMSTIRRAIAEGSTPIHGSVRPIHGTLNICAYCPSEVANSGDLVCAECLQPASVKLSHYCTDCDGRLHTASERRSGYCSGCVGYYDIPPAVELKNKYRPFGRLPHQRTARVS